MSNISITEKSTNEHKKELTSSVHHSQSYAAGAILANPKKTNLNPITPQSIHTTSPAVTSSPLHSTLLNNGNANRTNGNNNNNTQLSKTTQSMNVALTPVSAVTGLSTTVNGKNLSFLGSNNNLEPKRKTHSVEELKRVLSSAALSQHTTVTVPSFVDRMSSNVNNNNSNAAANTNNTVQQVSQPAHGSMVYPPFAPIGYPMYDPYTMSNPAMMQPHQHQQQQQQQQQPVFVQHPYGTMSTVPPAMNNEDRSDTNDNRSLRDRSPSPLSHRSNRSGSPENRRNRSYGRNRRRSQSDCNDARGYSSDGDEQQDGSTTRHGDGKHNRHPNASRRHHEGRRRHDDEQTQSEEEPTDAEQETMRSKHNPHVQRFIKKWEKDSDSGENVGHQETFAIDTDTESKQQKHKTDTNKKRTKKKKPKDRTTKKTNNQHLKSTKKSERYVPAQTEEEKVMEQMTDREITLEMIAAVEESKLSFTKGFDIKTASRFQKELELHRLNHLKGLRKFVQRWERQMMRIITVVTTLAIAFGVDDVEMKSFKKEMKDAIEAGEFSDEFKLLYQRMGSGPISRRSVGQLFYVPLVSFGTALLVSLMPAVLAKIFHSKAQPAADPTGLQNHPAHNPYMLPSYHYPPYGPPNYPHQYPTFLSHPHNGFPTTHATAASYGSSPNPSHPYGPAVHAHPHQPQGPQANVSAPHLGYPPYLVPHSMGTHPQPPHTPGTPFPSPTAPLAVNHPPQSHLPNGNIGNNTFSAPVAQVSSTTSTTAPNAVSSTAEIPSSGSIGTAPWMQRTNLNPQGKFVPPPSNAPSVAVATTSGSNDSENHHNHNPTTSTSRVPVGNESAAIEGVFQKMGPMFESIFMLSQSDGTEEMVKSQRESNKAYNHLLKEFGVTKPPTAKSKKQKSTEENLNKKPSIAKIELVD